MSAPDPRTREYAARFNRVLDHIRIHLGEPLDLESLARVACFSPFHFHRLFRAWTGETLHDCIQRLRVEKAAFLLAYQPLRAITDIALDCGFSSSATFARAFRAFYGTTASTWRRERIRKIRKTKGKTGKAPAWEVAATWGSADRFGPWRDNPMHLDVEIKPLDPIEIAYLRHQGPYVEDVALFGRLFGRLCAWAGPRGLLGPQTRFLSLYHDNPDLTEPEKLRVDVALTVPAHLAPEGEIGRATIPAGRYAVARIRIRPDQYREAWDSLMGLWLPESGYQPESGPCFEIMLNDPARDPEGMHEVELHLGVRPL